MDSEAALLTTGLREATLLIASACEARANAFGEEQSIISKNDVKQIDKRSGLSFAEKYYRDLPDAVCSRSLLTEKPAEFALIDEAYRERNKLMHTGKFSTAFGQRDELSQFKRATEWIAAARVATSWLDSLLV